MKNWLLSSFCIFLVACGYQWGLPLRPTVMVAYANGDETGALTTQVVQAIAESGLLEIKAQDAQLKLELVVLNDRNETIGFRRDPQEIRGKIRKNLLASEGRRILEMRATFYRTGSEEPLWGPFRLAAEADYDYIDGDSIRDLSFVSASGVPVTVLPFSLGQLEPMETAQEAASHVLYTALAKKLVDAISSKMVERAP